MLIFFTQYLRHIAQRPLFPMRLFRSPIANVSYLRTIGGQLHDDEPLDRRTDRTGLQLLRTKEASLRFHNLANETEHLSAHMDQVDDAVFLDLSVDHTKFAKAAVNIRLQVHVKKHLSKIESTRATIIAEKTIRRMSTLRKNLSLIFQGPTASALDIARKRRRMSQTSLRCWQIRNSRPDSIISWAAALPATDWKSSDSMSNEVFRHLIDKMEAAGDVQPWPPVVRTVLLIFQAEVVPHSEEFNNFLDGKLPSPLL